VRAGEPTLNFLDCVKPRQKPNSDVETMHRSTSAGLLGVDTNNVTNGFLRAPDGRITTIDVPGAAGTLAAGINDPGRITGF
jgi:hypothetical protein